MEQLTVECFKLGAAVGAGLVRQQRGQLQRLVPCC